MASKAELALILSLVDDVSKTAKGVRGELQAVGKEASGLQGMLTQVGKVGLVAVGAGIAAVSAGIAASAKVAWDAAMQMDEALDTVQIKTGATSERMEQLRTVLEDVATSTHTGATIDTISASLAELDARLDASDEDLYNLTLGITELSQMTGGDASKNASTFARVIGNWQVPAEEARGLMDRLFVLTQQSGVGFETLTEQLNANGLQLRAMGFDLDTSAALLATWEKHGLDATQMMAGLKIGAAKFAKEGKPLKQSLLGVIEQMQNAATETDALQIGLETFGARGGTAIAQAVREGQFAIEDLVAMMGDAQGAIEETARATEDWPEKVARMKNQVVVALAPIGEAFTGLAGKILDRLGPALDKIGPWLEDNVVPAFEKLGGAVDTFFRGLDTGRGPLESFKDVLWTLLPPGLAAELTGAIAWVQQLVADAEAGDWSAVGTAIWEQVQTAFTNAIAWGGDVIAKLSEKLSTALQIEPTYTFTDAGLVKSDVWGDIGKEIIARIVEALATASDALVEWVTNPQTITAMHETGNAIGKAVGGFIAAFFGTPGTYEESQTATELENMMARVRDNIAEALRTIGREMGGEIYAGIIEGLTGETPQAGVERAIQKAKATPPSWYTRFWEVYKEWYDSLPDWFTGSVTGEPMQAPSRLIPGANASGTDYWRGGPTWVGERGPEILNVPRGSQIISNEEARGMGNTYVTIGAGAVVINNPRNAQEAEIGVLRGLRALGVGAGA